MDCRTYEKRMRPTMAMTGLLALPEDCRAEIISRTSPRDVCRLACISTDYRSTFDSNSVWQGFLPPHYLLADKDIPEDPDSASLKQRYFQTCHNKLSFWLDKPSGKKCYMISARELKIMSGEDPECWRWIHLPEARFPEVAKLKGVRLFDISAKISTSILSPRTAYVFYLVFKPIDPYRYEDYSVYGFKNNPVEVTIGLADGGGQTRTVYLDPTQARFPRDDPRSFAEKRGDGWCESELGEYFYKGDKDAELSITIMELKSRKWMSGLVFQGIEIRPKRV